MRYLSVAEIAKKWDVSERSVRNYCAQGRVNSAFLIGKTWNIPENAEKPERTNKRKDKPTTLLDILKEQKASKCSGGIYHKTQIELTYNSNHMVGIVCQFDLCFMVDPTGAFTCLLFFQNIQQSSRFIFSFVGTLRLFCVFRNVPCLADKKRTVHTPLGAVISNTALGHIPLFRYFSN